MKFLLSMFLTFSLFRAGLIVEYRHIDNLQYAATMNYSREYCKNDETYDLFRSHLLDKQSFWRQYKQWKKWKFNEFYWTELNHESILLRAYCTEKRKDNTISWAETR